MRPIVIITETLDDRPARWLADHAEVLWCPHDQPDKLREPLSRAQGLVVRTYTQVNDALLDGAPNLKVIGRAGVGLDNFDLEACKARGVKVVYTPDANTQAVVEYVMGLMLDDIRPRADMPAHVNDKAFHQSRKENIGRQLNELTLGILGFGRIGKRLARAARGIGMARILVNDIIPESQLRPLVEFDVDFVDQETLFQKSDILSVHVDGRPENRRLVNAANFAHLKPDCLFINAARGMLVDEHALADWAKAHSAGRLILDVHEPEPPPTDYPLYDLPNVRLLPHIASRTHTALANMSWVVRDVMAVINQQPPEFPAT